MYRKKINLMMCYMLLFLLAWVSCVQAQTHLQYQDRGNRHEGIKLKPVSGYDIELISVRADYKEQADPIPDTFKLRFYLNQDSDVYLTVRELEYKYYYWMDEVQPEHWNQGFQNEFVWPTQEVIRQLDRLEMYDLGSLLAWKEKNRARRSRSRRLFFIFPNFLIP